MASAAARRGGKRSRAAAEVDDDDLPFMLHDGGNDHEEISLDDDLSGLRKKPRMSAEPLNASGSKATEGSETGDTHADMDTEDEAMSRMEVDASADTRMSGQVRRVYMTNLRCHRHFELSFTPHSNFIAGRNGSGKSTILTAIRLALGWTPSKGSDPRTGKPTNGFESIIRGRVAPGVDDDLSAEASVEVDFSNVGVDAFQPELYGSAVRIRRVMKRSAAGRVNSSYDVFKLGKKGPEKVPGKGKEHMEALRDGWGISAMNPVMIMDQETSKKFLAGNTREQYKFFLDATLLSKGYNANVALAEQLLTAKMYIAAKEESISELRAKAKTAAIAYARIEEVLKLQSKIQDAENDVLWARAHDGARAAAAAFTAAEKDMDSTTAAESKVKQLDDVHAGKQAAVTTARNALDTALESIAARRVEVEEVTAQLAAASKSFAALRLAADASSKEVKSASQALEKSKKALATVIADRAEQAGNSARDEWQRAIDATAARAAAAEAELKSHRAAEPPPGRLEQAAGAVAAAEEEVQALSEQQRMLEGNLKLLSAGAREVEPWDALRRNPRNAELLRVRDLYTEMHRTGRLSRLPLDPLGMYVRCDAGWMRAVESVMGLRVTTIAFTDAGDAAAFEVAAREAKLRPQYLARSAATGRYDVHPTGGGLRPLLDVMTIENDDAFNALVDDMAAHRVFIASSTAEVEERGTMRMANGMMAMRGDAKAVVLPDGRTVSFKGSGMTVRREDSHAPPGVVRVRRAADALPQVREELATVVRDLKAAQLRLDEARKAHKAVAATVEAYEARLKALTAAAKKARDAANRAASEPEPEVPEDDAMAQEQANAEALVAAAQIALEAAEAKADAAAAAVTAPQQQVQALKLEMRRLQHEVDEDEGVRSAEAAYKAAEADLRSFAKRREDAVVVYAERKQGAVDRLTAAQGGVTAAQTLLATTAAETGMAEAREPTLTESKASGILKGAKAALAKQGSGHDEAAVKKIEQQYQVLKAAVEAEEELLAQTQRNYATMTAERKSRQKQWKENRERLGKRAAKYFKGLMQRKGFEAKLIMTHDEGEGNTVLDSGDIRVMVAPDHDARHGGGFTQMGREDTRAESVLQEVGTLSGGEKSLSTLMLMAAFAKVCTVPFRIIDEFDVFQDEANRKFSMDILIELAGTTDHEGRKPQYLLLTPHDISAAVVGKADVSVYKLADPERQATDA